MMIKTFIQTCLLLLFTSFLSGCVTILSTDPADNPKMSYKASNPMALMTMVDLNKSEPVFELRRTDMKTRKFVGPPIRIYGCVLCWFKNESYAIENDEVYERQRFVAKAVEAGSYAFVKMTETFYGSAPRPHIGLSELIDHGCYGISAPVFDVKAGSVNLIGFDGIDVIGLDSIQHFMNLLEINLKAQPGIVAPTRPSTPKGYISFMHEGMDPEDCTSASGAGKTFEILKLEDASEI